jgi:germination protein M
MIHTRIGKITAVLGISAMLTAGCSLFGPANESTSIDPPPQSEPALETKPAGEAPLSGEQAQAPGDAVASVDRTVYLLDANGYVVPVSLTLPKEEGVAKQVLSYMVKGGPVEGMLPQGFAAVLPEGTKILGMVIKDGTATVDFSKEFKNYDAKDEKKIMDAITRALTEFPNIKNVSIWVSGKPLSEMPVNNTPVSRLDRNHGVNVELAEGAIPGQTSAVTVYFQSQLDDKRTYYVPVTRLIPKTKDLARAVVEELIKGPKEGSPLFSALLSTTKVLDVRESDGTVTVNLSSDILKYDSGKEANPESLESLVLSLTENTGFNKVQLLVEGKPISGGSFDFSKPVVRPLTINTMQF